MTRLPAREKASAVQGTSQRTPSHAAAAARYSGQRGLHTPVPPQARQRSRIANWPVQITPTQGITDLSSFIGWMAVRHSCGFGFTSSIAPRRTERQGRFRADPRHGFERNGMAGSTPHAATRSDGGSTPHRPMKTQLSGETRWAHRAGRRAQ